MGISGCSSSQESPPEQTVETYGRDVSDADWQKLESAAYVRSLDPCALLDNSFVEQFGPVVQFGPRDNLATCTAAIGVEGQMRETPNYVRLELSAYRPVDEFVEVDLDGVTAVRSDRATYGSECGVRFPIPRAPVAESTGEIVVLPPVAWASVESTDDASCVVVDTTARHVLDMLKTDPPLRQLDTSIALAFQDPCDVLGRLPDGVTVTHWQPSIRPYDCEVWVAGDTEDEVIQVSLTLAKDDEIQRGETAVDMSGVTVIKENSSYSRPGARLYLGDSVDNDLIPYLAKAAGATNNRAFPVLHIYAPTWQMIDALSTAAVDGFAR